MYIIYIEIIDCGKLLVCYLSENSRVFATGRRKTGTMCLQCTEDRMLG
jgi:RNase P subunit RPR2